MKRLFTLKVWVTVLAATLMTTALSAQQPQTGPAAAPPLQAQQADKYVVGQAKPPEVAGSAVIELTLEQATQIALENNLDLAVQKMNPQLQDYNLVIAQAAFRPTLNGSFNGNHSSNTSTSLLEGVTTSNISVSQAQSYNMSMSQTMPWYGGRLTASFNNGRSGNNNINSTRNPSFSSSTQVQYSQPLLQGFKIDQTRNNLRTQSVQRQITDLQLANQVETVKANVRVAYWALRGAIEAIEIGNRALALALQTDRDNKTKVDIGTLAPIDTTQSEVSVANAQQAVLNAQIQWTTAELNLKRLLVSSADDDLYKKTINPTDLPNISVQSVDINAAVKEALDNRSDIVQQEKNMEIAQLNLEVTKNSVLPQLNANASYQISGTGGPTLTHGVKTAEGNYFDAFRNIWTLNTPTWSVGVSFQYPLGMVQQKASYARAQIQFEQQKAQLKSLQLNLYADVTNAGLAVQNAYLRYLAAQKSRDAQEKNTAAAQTRFDNGMSTPFEVATAIQNLTSARLAELNAVISYLNAVAEFERKQRVGG